MTPTQFHSTESNQVPETISHQHSRRTCRSHVLPRYCSGLALLLTILTAVAAGQPTDDPPLATVRSIEHLRHAAIQSVIGSVVAIYDAGREGGGSGVVIDPSGLALTNHHVILAAGVSGLAGLADGKLYPWDLIATDPGGDLALIRLKADHEFPFAPLGNSDRVRVGDWALAMGNPFVLAEDHVPTVTLGIVSGVKRFQEGAGLNQLVYGNCIQTDSSINPGNSGGPLFDLAGTIIGINGRASFLERGRVNVGLGYAISSNQARNFLGDLLATVLVQHGTLDANFSEYTGKGILCSTINELSAAAEAGLGLSDQLIEFEGQPIETANQFASLICTLPRDWPATLLVKKPTGELKQITVRLAGLPYPPPPPAPPLPNEAPREAPPEGPPDEDVPGQPLPPNEGEAQQARQAALLDILGTPPATIRDLELNHFCRDVIFRRLLEPATIGQSSDVRIETEVTASDQSIVRLETRLSRDGTFSALWQAEETSRELSFDGKRFLLVESGPGDSEKTSLELTRTEAKQEPAIVDALSLLAVNDCGWFSPFGEASIHGSDKADGQPSIRLKSLDAEQDWFYAWIDTGFASGGSEHRSRLLKTSADLNSDGRGGAMIFRSWKARDGWLVPELRINVEGLADQPRSTWSTKSVEANQ